MVTTSLDAMASGGMYDHLGGGFARYSVDNEWLVPHFEKMLYDQALLARIYLHAWQVTGEARYRQVLDEVVTYVLRDLRHETGGCLQRGGRRLSDRRRAQPRGRVLRVDRRRDRRGARRPSWPRKPRPGGASPRPGTSRAPPSSTGPCGVTCCARPTVEEARRRLFEARELRPRPGLDDKVLTEWNGLFLATLAEAAAATGTASWLEAAVQTGEFLLANLRRDDGRWLRSWQADGGARHLALAADHAALVVAFVALAEATGQARWITEARAVADAMLDLFWDPMQGALFTTGEDAEVLVARQKDLLDNATPAANSQAAIGLYRLGALTGEARYTNHADQILRLLGPLTTQSALAFANVLAADRPAPHRHHRDRRRRRPARARRGGAAAVHAERRAGLGRAVPITALGAAPRRVRLRVPRVHLPGPRGHRRGAGGPARLARRRGQLPRWLRHAARSSTCTAHAEPSPMTCVRPTLAPSTWRSPASPRRWVATS